jgi:hypothetical protein
MSKILAAIILCIMPACASAPPPNGLAPNQPTMTFKFNGCSRELSSDDSYETTVARQDRGATTIFHVSHAATCGLDVRHPNYSISDNRLELTYEMYSQTGAVVMCDCGYRSQFTFTNLPASVKSASFSATFDEP